MNMSDEMSRMKRKRPTSSNEIESPEGESVSIKESEKWSEELHRCFVDAIYDAGVSQSSPSVIMENMSNRSASLTSERVKSHLQKYRKNKQKSKEDFMHDYDCFMRKALTVSGAVGGASHVIMPPAAMIEMMGGGKPSGGDIAAFISYSVMTEGEIKTTSGTSISSIGIAKESQDYLKNFAGTHVPFPQLSEEEKRSPLGISMVYVMGLFSSLSQHMMDERRKKLKPNSPHSDVAGVPGTELTVTSIPAFDSMSSNFTSNSNAFLNTTQAIPSSALIYAGQLKQHSQGNMNTSWGDPAMKQMAFLEQQETEDGVAQAVAIAPSTGAELEPMPSRGFFHPILTNAELVDSKNTAMRPTNWNISLVQPIVAIFDGQLLGQANVSNGRGPPHNQGAPSGSAPFAQV